MVRSTLLLTAVSISGALIVGACGSDDGGDDKGESGGTGSSTYYGGYGGSEGGSGGTYYGGSGGSDGGSAGSSQGGAAGGSQGGAAGGGGLSPIDGSCQNHCGDPTPPPGGAKCYCDNSCVPIGDCCSDYDQYCDSGTGGSGGSPSGGGGSGGSGGSPGGLTSCVGHCGDQGPVPGSSPSCYCDELCIGNNDCCFDFNVACAFSGNGGSGGGSGTPTCTGHCGKITPVPGSSPPCYCDITCSLANDCCPDYDTKC